MVITVVAVYLSAGSRAPMLFPFHGQLPPEEAREAARKYAYNVHCAVISARLLEQATVSYLTIQAPGKDP